MIPLLAPDKLADEPGLADPAAAVENDHPPALPAPLLLEQAGLHIPVDELPDHD